MLENRNYIIAIVLSILVVLGWNFFVAAPYLEKQRRLQEASQPAAPQAPAVPGAPGAPATTQPGVSPGVPSALPSVAALVTRDGALAQSPRVPIETPALTGSIALKGGRIDDTTFTAYRETTDKNSPRVNLLTPAGTTNAYYVDFGWLPDPLAPVKVPTADTVWTQQGTGALTPSNPVTLVWDNGDGLTFRRIFTVDSKYMFKVTDEVTAAADKAARLTPYSGIRRIGTPPLVGFAVLHEGLIGVLADGKLQEITYKSMIEQKKVEEAKTTGAWIGFVDKYWATALIPEKTATTQPIFTAEKSGGVDAFQTYMVGEPAAVAGGGSASATTRLFAGAKEVSTVDGYAEEYSIAKFDRLIDWGYFYFLTKPLFFVIDWLYKLFGNFGVAILLVTLMLKALFYPIANKSYESMTKMKKVQPEMKELQERFKDDKMKQQQAMMELYKREKINPLTGCVPILLQIPVFFALYKVLLITIEMRQAPFFGWIQDLAAPDPTSLFNLFGLLPFTPPHALMIGIWPLIMGVTMFVQMKLNPPPPDPTQKMIFDWMPLIFTFMLASFPAGLVIYWAWNNTLSVAQQSLIMKKYGVKIELWDNLKSVFRRSAAPSS